MSVHVLESESRTFTFVYVWTRLEKTSRWDRSVNCLREETRKSTARHTLQPSLYRSFWLTFEA